MLLRQILPWMTLPICRTWSSINPGARILMYHRINDTDEFDQLSVGPDNFAAHMCWLSENYTVLSLPEITRKIQTGSIENKLIALTFDDGYLDNLENALPVLEKYNIPATIYITTGFAAQSLTHPRYKMDRKRLHLNWTEVAKLARHPLIHIGSHTSTHPMLSELSESRARSEIIDSKAELEERIGVEIRDFCYPSGNFTQREESIVRQAGYSWAVSVKPGNNKSGTNLFALRRTEITDRDSIASLEQKLNGAFDVFHWLLDIKREMRFSKHRQSLS